MPSQRNNDAILDAARDCVLDVGLRRTTLADVARRAGVSRMTVYRQHADLDSLVAALLTRELTALLDQVMAELTAVPTARERLVEAAVQVVQRLEHHPLYRRILDLDPELLLPLVVDRFGSSQKAAMALVETLVVEGRRDGSVRDVPPATAATVVLLTAQSFVLSARLVGEDVRRELRTLLEGYLR